MNARPMTAGFAPRDTVEPRGSGELGMRMMLTGVIVFLGLSDIFAWQLGLGPGLSAKNALLYLLAVGLVFKFAVQGGFRAEVPFLHACFAVLIGYAIISMLAAGLIIEYQRYDLVHSAMKLKSVLIDQMVFFVVFFYGLRSSRSAHSMLSVLLFAVAAGNFVAVLNSLGVIQVGELVDREDGRMEGVMGEANQYGAFVVLFLPALVNAAMNTPGVMRLFWAGGAFVSACALVMTVSRGAFVSITVGCVCGWLMFRRYLSPRKIVAVVGTALLGLLAVIGVLSARYGSLLYERVLEQSGSGMQSASSGRSEVWATAVSRMFDTPLSLLTGFGWDVYDAMPFRYSTHNHYLGLWFNLGLFGLFSGILLFVQLGRTARGAVDVAAGRYQSTLIAFVVGLVSLTAAVFFVDLYAPWPWFWAYAGLVTRIAVNARNAAAPFVPGPQVIEPAEPKPAQGRADLYGWTARSQ